MVLTGMPRPVLGVLYSVYKRFRHFPASQKKVINVCTNDIKVLSIKDRYKIIEECHSSTKGGHLGIAKTYRRILDNFY